MKPSASVTSPKTGVRLVNVVHSELRKHIFKGDTVVDATVGNGHDTLALAQWVGNEGHVIGFDIQPKAIAATRNRLIAHDLLQRVSLHCLCHSRMHEVIKRPAKAILFNLGYLPGADHELTTLPATTLAALDSSWEILQENGILSVVAYPGHPGGDVESDTVNQWMQAKAASGHPLITQQANPAQPHSPAWFCLHKINPA
jgi:hypothetical protein